MPKGKVPHTLRNICHHRGDYRKASPGPNSPDTAQNPVLEMETAAVAQAASEQNVPVAALRAISDGADEHLEFSIADIADSEMRIRVRKVLWTLVRKPRIIPQLVRLGKNSQRGGDNLAVAVIAFIDGI